MEITDLESDLNDEDNFIFRERRRINVFSTLKLETEEIGKGNST